MSLSDKLQKLVSPGLSGSDLKTTQAPEEWRPRLDLDESKGGFVVSKPRPASEIPDAEEILKEFNLDPSAWSVTSLRRSQWQTFSGEWLTSVRVNLLPVDKINSDLLLDADKLISEIKKWRPQSGLKLSNGKGSYSLFPSDQQIGKKNGDGGTEQSVGRILSLTEESVAKYKSYKKLGLNLGTIVMGLPGDHVEGIVSQNGRLQGQAASDLGITEQVRVARRLLMSQVKAHAQLAERLVIAVVNGNHDESTRQVAADPADGWNTEIASAVQDACMENPSLSHVEFRFPSSGHQTLTVDVDGTMLGLFHGHQISGDVTKYIANQAAGQTALGMADVWVSGHFHNFKTADIGHRLWLQAPTTDPGSDWFRDKSGMRSKPGLLTAVIGGQFDPREFISVLQSREY